MSKKEEIIEKLKTVYDPEVPVNIYDFGLIYNIELDNNIVNITMTMTSPNCPVAEELPGWVEEATKSVEGIESCNINVVWDPPWDSSMISEEGKEYMEMAMNMDFDFHPFNPHPWMYEDDDDYEVIEIINNNEEN